MLFVLKYLVIQKSSSVLHWWLSCFQTDENLPFQGLLYRCNLVPFLVCCAGLALNVHHLCFIQEENKTQKGSEGDKGYVVGMESTVPITQAAPSAKVNVMP